MSVNIPEPCLDNPCTSKNLVPDDSSNEGYGYCCSLCGLEKTHKGGFDSLTLKEKASFCFWSGLPSAFGELSDCNVSPTANFCPIASSYDGVAGTTGGQMPDCSRVTVQDSKTESGNPCTDWFYDVRENPDSEKFIDSEIDKYCSLRRNQQFVEQSTNTKPQLGSSGPFNDCLCWAAVNGYDKNYNEIAKALGPELANHKTIACFWPPCNKNNKDQLLPAKTINNFECSTVCKKVLQKLREKNVKIPKDFEQYLIDCSENTNNIWLIIGIFILFVIIIAVAIFLVFYYK